MGTDLDSVPENTGKVKKTKSKKAKHSDDALVEPTKVDPRGGDDAELKKEKKRKRKAEKVGEDDEKPKKSKKRKKEQNISVPVEDGPAPTSTDANAAGGDIHELKDKKREKKKKDKKHKKASEGCTDEPSKDEDRIKDKKKKRRGDTVANPEEDDTLEDQARKALVYVYTQIEMPSQWKFNKAKQNWLIRNIWSSQSVPDKYFPQVIRNLGDSKGAARENLIQSCRAQLERPNESTDGAADANANGVSSAQIDEVKQDRASRLLVALGQVS